MSSRLVLGLRNVKILMRLCQKSNKKAHQKDFERLGNIVAGMDSKGVGGYLYGRVED